MAFEPLNPPILLIIGGLFIMPEFKGVMAAPNRSQIKAKVLSLEQSSEYPDKWIFDLEILESKNISGPDFAHVGERANGFAFDPLPDISSGDVVAGEAEFLGDERGGKFRLSEIKIISQA